MAIWLCRYVAMWLCGHVAMSLYGYVAMWLCGYVAKFQISKFAIFEFSKFKLSISKYSNLQFADFQFFKFHIPKFHMLQFCECSDFQNFNSTNSKSSVHILSEVSKMQILGFAKITCFEHVSRISLYRLKYFGIFIKSINKGSLGLENAEIMEMLGFGPSHNKIDILLDQN